MKEKCTENHAKYANVYYRNFYDNEWKLDNNSNYEGQQDIRHYGNH